MKFYGVDVKGFLMKMGGAIQTALVFWFVLSVFGVSFSVDDAGRAIVILTGAFLVAIFIDEMLARAVKFAIERVKKGCF